MKQEMFQIGAISTTHGLKGEVKVYPSTEDVNRFSDLKGQDVIMDPEGKNMTLTIQSVRYFKGQAIVKFKGLDRIEDVENFRKLPLFITREQAIPLEEDEYYTADLFDMKVVDEDGQDLGIISDVITTGANDVYLVHKEGRKDIMIPAIKVCVKKVDLEENCMTVHLLDGLMDL